ncbi:ankyrin repeat and SAM domain-containing protein 4B [Acipenser oxyrinchus oxyrinchus]|uniref:Ankyrin repeat and SAM domain-containing protein 4B n=1 Tax=Acipenser oxyrinchus oxyrinchus TaxID=40147 RepID=A0AAD8G179_ACIOX|nr:ankyrin repeat and SAM domain-containing protein 4B [Acipenser oxyrinchus oxyrinchus]
MSTRYHKAAIDGYLELLKDATRKDLNTPDEDGMTPTLWAAYHGHAEALQLICSRGGDPDRSDIWGNSPLHHAAANGLMHVITFLVNFGANIFSLDNDFHTPMDVAASKDHMECVRFLDAAANNQTAQNPKKVAKQKEQASKEAMKKVKICEKVQQKHESKMNKIYQREHQLSRAGSVRSSIETGTINSMDEQFSKLIAAEASGTLTSRIKGTLQKKLGKKGKNTVERQVGDNVIFVKQENGTLGRTNVMDVFNEHEENEAEQEGGYSDQDGEDDSQNSTTGHKDSIFNRPGLGHMVFRRNFTMGLTAQHEEISYNTENEDIGFRIRDELFQSEARGEADEGYEEKDRNLPWNEDEIGLEDEEETSNLAAFLASLNLVEFAPIFSREQLDLEALMLCSDEDLRSIHIQLGPRKKILEAAGRRKRALTQPSTMVDSLL